MVYHGFLRVAAVCPNLRVADVARNVDVSVKLLQDAVASGADLAVFPELGFTGYTCHDLFHQSTLTDAAESGLKRFLGATTELTSVVVVGLPVRLDGMVFNTAAVCHRGRLLGVIPKSYLPNYKEFYDARYFQPGERAISPMIRLAGQSAAFGTNLLFVDDAQPDFVLGVEICEDLWMPVPPSSLLATAGATVLANLSASNETIGKSAYRRQLVVGQSGRCLAGYVYAAAGTGESTTDLVFGGHCIVAENGSLLAESARFRRDSHITITDIDLGRLTHDRAGNIGFHQRQQSLPVRKISFASALTETRTRSLIRVVDPHPFVPADPNTRTERCQEIFATQVAGLAKRFEHISQSGSAPPTAAIGVSGGLDSTLALLVACKTFDLLEIPRSHIHALTMPGFGTTTRTLANSRELMRALGVTLSEIDIRPLCLEQMRSLGHKPFGISLDGLTVDTLTAKLSTLTAEHRHDVVFENVQARVRTCLIMNTGFAIGTGDVSELAVGWCTYNADQMSMYNPNVSIPKTLVRFLVRWAADNEFAHTMCSDYDVRRTLHDIADTEISPELLPTAADGTATQSTEASTGPYELVDFFLYHFLRWGCPPEKIIFLAEHARFDRNYTADELRHWLRIFLTRFFANQFKRSCMPDGPKVGSVSLSPRGDWRMPSDAVARAWLERMN